MKATKSRMVDSIQLANFILAKVGPMPHLKLQKLVYYVQAWHLAFFNEPIIQDDFQAWLHGPVSKKVWDTFKNPDNPLLNKIELLPEVAESALATFPAKLSPDQKDLINDVLHEYGKKSGYHLECLTHVETPWLEARMGVGIADKCSRVISKETMATFYCSRAIKQ
jgi:uncharacterized phage-associated protein